METTRTRLLTASAAVAAIATVLGVGLMLRPSVRPPAAAPAASPSPEPTPSPPRPTPGVPSAVPAVPGDAANQVRFLDTAMADRIRRMTITLPPWPDESLRRYCPAGRFTFAGGSAPTGGSEEPPGRGPWTYVVLFKGMVGILANVDGRAGDEIVLSMGCGDIENLFRLLVIKPDGNGFKAVGYVTDQRSLPGYDRFYGDGGDLVVEVNSDPMLQGIELRRRYRWQGSRFAAVGAVPATPLPVADIRTVDLRNGSFFLDTVSRRPGAHEVFGVSLSFVDGVSGFWPLRSEEFTHPGADIALGSVSTGRLDEPGDAIASAADALVTLTVRWDDGGTDQFVYRISGGRPSTLVTRTGQDGVTGVLSHRIVDGLAEVTVATTDGVLVRRYRSDGYLFTQVPL